jgi:hypothetical protein
MKLNSKGLNKKEKKECKNGNLHLSKILIFKNNKFQIDYSKILKCRDENEIQST